MLLVIGYGNSLRNDDSVGRRVAEAIAALGLAEVQTLSCDLLTPELADQLSRSKAVIFVDAAVDAPSDVLLRPLQAAQSSQVMAHAADPRTMLALARDVFGHVPQAWWLTIPVADLGIGEQLSTLAQAGMREAIQRILRLYETVMTKLSLRGHSLINTAA
jgi:hydrogenase maturation protease